MKKYSIIDDVFTSFRGDFTKEDFIYSSIWYEYDIPEEIDYLSKKFSIKKNLLIKKLIDNSDPEHFYYTLHNEKNVLKQVEFAFFKTKIKMCGYSFDGYFSVINGELNVPYFFIDNQTFQFYTDELFDEDNEETLLFLSNYFNDKRFLKQVYLEYQLSEDIGVNPSRKYKISRIYTR